MGSNLSFHPILTKFAPEVYFCIWRKDTGSDFWIMQYLTPFWPGNGAKWGKMGSNLSFYLILTNFAPEVHFCIRRKVTRSDFWEMQYFVPFCPHLAPFSGQNGIKNAFSENLTPYPFFKCKNTPLVRISLKSGENSNWTPFGPVSGPKWGKYCITRKSDPVPFL